MFFYFFFVLSVCLYQRSPTRDAFSRRTGCESTGYSAPSWIKGRHTESEERTRREEVEGKGRGGEKEAREERGEGKRDHMGV